MTANNQVTSQPIKTTEKYWAKMSAWQRFVFLSAAAAILGWPFSKALDWLASNISWLSFLSIFAQLIVEFISNKVVIAFFVGALLASSGPSLLALYRRVGAGTIFGAIFVCGILASFGFFGWQVFSMVYSGIFERPRIYTAPAEARRNPDGSARVFTTFKIRDFNQPFEDETELVAKNRIQSQIGKWIAVTGVVSNVTPEIVESGFSVSLRSKVSGIFDLDFGPEWTSRIVKLKKGERIYAVCEVRTADASNLYLRSCELSHK